MDGTPLSGRNIDPDLANIRVLLRTPGAEWGCRFEIGKDFLANLAAWTLYMEEGLVFFVDGGSAEVSGETRILVLLENLLNQTWKSIQLPGRDQF